MKPRRPPPPVSAPATATRWPQRLGDVLWYGALIAVGVVALWKTVTFVHGDVPVREIGRVVLFGCITLLRVAVLIAIASLIWVPIGVWVGMRPRVASIVQPIAQFLAAFPANLFFGFVVSAIVILKLSPDIWLSPLMILGTQWYILFNVIVGASAISPELRYVGQNLGVQGVVVVEAPCAAGGLSLLRDRGHHGRWRFVERQHRVRGRLLG